MESLVIGQSLIFMCCYRTLLVDIPWWVVAVKTTILLFKQLVYTTGKQVDGVSLTIQNQPPWRLSDLYG